MPRSRSPKMALLVSGGLPMSKQTIVRIKQRVVKWIAGHAYPPRATTGALPVWTEREKPFLHNSHVKIEFDGTKPPAANPIKGRPRSCRAPPVADGCGAACVPFARFCDPHGQGWNLVNETDNPNARKNFVRQVGDARPDAGGLGPTDREIDRAAV